MIGFTLSEKEFDYELQALATGFSRENAHK